MIVTRLSGGLGNQLFQYAAGRSLSLKNNCPLYLDTSFYGKSPNRKYMLGEFNIADSKVSVKEVYRSFNAGGVWLKDVLLRKQLLSSAGATLYREKGFEFDPQVSALKSPVILDGYWQSEKYFAGNEMQLRNELSLKRKIVGEASGLQSEMLQNPSVAIHIRRGDYMSNPEISKIHGVCSEDYYVKSWEFISERVPAAVPFVFTDDIAFGKRMIDIFGKGVLVSELTHGDTLLDFELMQSARHFIIANSTFSWWGAWLSRSADKVVVAPRNWFRTSAYNTNDLFPVAWTLL